MGSGPAKIAALCCLGLVGCKSEPPRIFTPPADAPMICLGGVDVYMSRAWGPGGQSLGPFVGHFLDYNYHPEAGRFYIGMMFAMPGQANTPPPDYTVSVQASERPNDPQTAVKVSHAAEYDSARHRWLIIVVTNFRPTDPGADVTFTDPSNHKQYTFRNVSLHGH